MSGNLFKKNSIVFPIVIFFLFFTAFSTLSIVRHLNYQSFGYDLGINDQVVWRYSNFQLPFTTIDPFPTKTKFAEHVELVYALIAPFYWIYSSPITLILVRNAWFCASSLAVFLIARRNGLNYFVSLALMMSYLGFYGVQSAIWTDVHSNSFANGFLMWFIYFLETKRKKLSITAFFLAITAKENIGLAAFVISFVFFIKERSKLPLFLMATSVAYVAFIFLIFFPHVMQVNYLYANNGGILSNFNPMSFFDTADKRQVIWYSFLSFGFLPLLSPLYLLPVLGNLAMYFVIASDLAASHTLYGHYRIGLAVFLSYATIKTISRFKWLNKWYIGLYLIFFTFLVQYILHLPLSYLTKQWFWTKPLAVDNINKVIANYLPNDASVVSQNNITPHISQRDKIYTLYPEKKIFKKDSPCRGDICNWFHWDDNPQFLIIDISSDWDVRHFLTDRQLFVDGISNLEKRGVITSYEKAGNTVLYKVNRNQN